MSPRRRRLSASFTTIQRTGWRLPPVAALPAASRMVQRSSSLTGLVLSSRRMARVVRIASNTSMPRTLRAMSSARSSRRTGKDLRTSAHERETQMATITASMFSALDGVVDPMIGDWHFPYFNEQMGEAVGKTHDADVMLFGRVTYDSF